MNITKFLKKREKILYPVGDLGHPQMKIPFLPTRKQKGLLKPTPTADFFASPL